MEQDAQNILNIDIKQINRGLTFYEIYSTVSAPIVEYVDFDYQYIDETYGLFSYIAYIAARYRTNLIRGNFSRE